jgi:predicted hydrocarbon binding protein
VFSIRHKFNSETLLYNVGKNIAAALNPQESEDVVIKLLKNGS